MAEFFDFDPVTGITTYTEEGDKPGDIKVIRKADISAVVEHAKAQRNAGIRDKGIKKGWWHYAYIPPIVMAEMYQKGIDVTNDGKAVAKFINENYPALKTTDKWHEDRRAKKRQ